jgi:hypothetical protein
VQRCQAALTDHFYLNGPTMPDGSVIRSLAGATADGLIKEIRGAIPLDEHSTKQLVSAIAEAFLLTVLVVMATERAMFTDALKDASASLSRGGDEGRDESDG